jgi:hypothetical protein
MKATKTKTKPNRNEPGKEKGTQPNVIDQRAWKSAT